MATKFDLHIRLVDPTQQTYGSNFTLNLSNTLKVNGKQKLVNKWVKIFMTPKGSHPFKRTLGTEFPYLIGGNIDSVAAVEGKILEYIEDATNQIKELQSQNPAAAPEEQLSTVNIVQFNQLDSTKVELWVEIINAVGTSVNVLIPYATGT